MATVTEIKKGPNVGVWASNKSGTVGLVANDHQNPYLVLFGKDPKTGGMQSFPALAIFVGTDGKAKLQLPGPKGTQEGVRQVDIETMLEMIGLGAATQNPQKFPEYAELAAMFPADEPVGLKGIGLDFQAEQRRLLEDEQWVADQLAAEPQDPADSALNADQQKLVGVLNDTLSVVGKVPEGKSGPRETGGSYPE